MELRTLKEEPHTAKPSTLNFFPKFAFAKTDDVLPMLQKARTETLDEVATPLPIESELPKRMNARRDKLEPADIISSTLKLEPHLAMERNDIDEAKSAAESTERAPESLQEPKMDMPLPRSP